MKLHNILKWVIIVLVAYFVYMLYRNSQISVAASGSIGA